MERVLGIGGIFFKARDPDALREWYRTHLGLDLQPWGGAVFEGPGQTVWCPFSVDTTYFNPSPAPYMFNYRVANLDRMLDQLRALGAQVDGRTDFSEQGRFGWVMDPEGNRVELWEPPQAP